MVVLSFFLNWAHLAARALLLFDNSFNFHNSPPKELQFASLHNEQEHKNGTRVFPMKGMLVPLCAVVSVNPDFPLAFWAVRSWCSHHFPSADACASAVPYHSLCFQPALQLISSHFLDRTWRYHYLPSPPARSSLLLHTEQSWKSRPSKQLILNINGWTSSEPRYPLFPHVKSKYSSTLYSTTKY